MAQQPVKKQQTVLETIREANHVEFGSPQHLLQLEAAYGMTKEEAELMIKDWEKDHTSYPLGEVRKARAMLEAMKAKPVAVSTDAGWRREVVE